MAEIAAGLRREENFLVTNDVAVDFLGMEEARVLSTPHLIGCLELVARNLLKERIEEGADSVGSEIQLRHLAATPVGMQVRVAAEVMAVDGRRVRFRVEAFDEREKIAEGAHERVIIDVARFAARVQAKAAGR
ncbi:MAG: thioesterase [Acidobacteria bacterium]|nr:thioesterase [Acidobacteriota bacterium]